MANTIQEAQAVGSEGLSDEEKIHENDHERQDVPEPSFVDREELDD
jgi:hypothetical protein